MQFRLAYVAHESSVVGTGELVADPKKIAKNYFFGFFFIDFLAALPIPQVSIPSFLGYSFLQPKHRVGSLFSNFIKMVVELMKK